MTKPVEFVWVPVDSIEANAYNPNSMDDETFNALAEDVAHEDLDQPIVVIPHKDTAGRFVIVDGEHRWRAAKANGLKDVPIVVRQYTEAEAMAHTMRRNVLRGTTDPKKFTLLVNKLKEQGLPLSKIQSMMAVREKEFSTLYRQTTEADKQVAANAQAASEKSTQLASAVANLSTMVREIMLEYGDTLPNGFVAFMYKGQSCLMVSMDDKLRKAVEEWVAAAKDSKLTGEEVAFALTRGFRDLTEKCS